MLKSPPQLDYTYFFFRLLNILGLLFTPKDWFINQYWRFNLLLIMVATWVAIIEFLFYANRVLTQDFEQGLRKGLTIACVVVMFYLSIGTLVLLHPQPLEFTTGECVLSAEVNGGYESYKLRVGSYSKHITEKQFHELLHPDQYVVEHQRSIDYPCTKPVVTASHVVYWGYLIDIE